MNSTWDGGLSGLDACLHGVVFDVTDPNRNEGEPAGKVDERMRDLEEENRQLRLDLEQQRVAEGASRRLERIDPFGQIAAGIAHDFGNLLGIILINARILSRRLLDAEDKECAELIRDAAERGARLTSHLVAFSHKHQLEPQNVNLNDVILATQRLLAATLGGGIDLHLKLAPDLWSVFADPSQIESVLLNLVINARDAMPAGGSVGLETFNAVIDDQPVERDGPQPGEYACVVVRDTGVGIPDEILPRIFEPFFTTKEAGKGAGLGLAQVFAFTKQSGGGVAIETRIGEGTSVTVFLPQTTLAE